MGPLGETYALRSHSATDLARLSFVSDVERLERFCDWPDQNGLALIVTNESSLWEEPGPRAKRTRDHEFRVHEGRTLTGTLLRGAEGYEPNTRTLHDSYRMDWQPYSQQGGACGEFRYLAVVVAPRGASAGAPTVQSVGNLLDG
ncbi:hypothetical protein [Actinacidiphila soli]|uniref:hypothetical protein n=1 Tax=Actinacidiphila soli TaxID=2487275 RepID=UPI001F0BFD75|nr:hypothetical protein [Actinacidiphila soli]